MKQDQRIDPQLKARVKWFLDFLYVDIESLPHAEFLKCLVDLEEIFSGAFSPFGVEGLWDEKAGITREFRIYTFDSPDYRRLIKGFQEYLKEIFNSILSGLDSNKPIKPLSRFQMTITIMIRGDKIALFSPRPKDALAVAFANALKPFSLYDIKKCGREDCERYFLKATKKEKRYCSNECAWVMASRKRREADSKKKKERSGKGGKR